MNIAGENLWEEVSPFFIALTQILISFWGLWLLHLSYFIRNSWDPETSPKRLCESISSYITPIYQELLFSFDTDVIMWALKQDGTDGSWSEIWGTTPCAPLILSGFDQMPADFKGILYFGGMLLNTFLDQNNWHGLWDNSCEDTASLAGSSFDKWNPLPRVSCSLSPACSPNGHICPLQHLSSDPCITRQWDWTGGVENDARVHVWQLSKRFCVRRYVG